MHGLKWPINSARTRIDNFVELEIKRTQATPSAADYSECDPSAAPIKPLERTVCPFPTLPLFVHCNGRQFILAVGDALPLPSNCQQNTAPQQVVGFEGTGKFSMARPKNDLELLELRYKYEPGPAEYASDGCQCVLPAPLAFSRWDILTGIHCV